MCSGRGCAGWRGGEGAILLKGGKVEECD
jgi:hypothetical protein